MIRKIIKAFARPGHALAGIVRKYWFLFHDDEKYLRLVYLLEMGHRLNLNNPVTFSEKLQWLKLYDRKPEYTGMVDKIAAKEYVAKIIGDKYIIPTIGVWKDFDDIDFSLLPNKFVLKTNHGSGGGGVVLCRCKATFDYDSARRKLEGSLRGNTYNKYREWPYKNIEPKIFAEQLVGNESETKALNDYKFYCFNGNPEYCQVIQNRDKNETIDFFDIQWNHQPFVGLSLDICNADVQPAKPKNFDGMVDIARQLSVGMTFSRIDLYEIDDMIYFGEITLYPASGIGSFRPREYDLILGQMLQLPEVKMVDRLHKG